MQKTFYAVLEDVPGKSWQRYFRKHWPATRKWYLGEGLDARSTAAEGRAALVAHMPEFVEIYDRLCSLCGSDDVAHRALSTYNLPPILPACSQAIWRGPDGPVLIRNYDFEIDTSAHCIEASRWFGRRVISMREAYWGCVDGMNDDGLVVCIAFGGRKAHGRGFAMPLVARYILETCRSTRDAIAVLVRVPVHIAQNVLLVDKSGDLATVFVGADRQPAVTSMPACANHQEDVVWRAMAEQNRTVERHECLRRLLAGDVRSEDSLINAFLREPLYVQDKPRGVATVYTAVYRPTQGSVDFLWPAKRWTQRFDSFQQGSYTHFFGMPRLGGPTRR
ncbi:C45 family autoproteolytic acyltransferase/hydrolase [Bradyrhizobium ontarionense]|uniref:C45 family autoproteolytic acyltransferase/hydrolase n=1 Tax=Bradyrhizobium ontarionense TaxID=2898149 RepID=A0ABY3R990_9BRAD|nr:C45 family autoproteolytic acyltransferase/hydolase [Bradyrhizobium sp. A19]UFZ03303.1 C45 family autoproteolytic acyltransferase/hydrolase [Bradyrhizobium sp. A19]